VDPASRRKGVARALLANHIERLRERGVRELFLEVDEDNRGALAFYEKFGLEPVGRRRAYYARSSGDQGAALVLHRDLDR
jgi:ribosomal-protein-alanine N-acetyltransferase